jgi:hypothetical protein
LLAARIVSPHHHRCQNAGAGEPKREKNKHPPIAPCAKFRSFFAGLAALGPGVHSGIRFDGPSGRFVFRSLPCSLPPAGLRIPGRATRRERVVAARPLIADLKLVGVSNLYQFD